MEKLECLLVHIPKSINYYRPLNYYSSSNWMSQSIFALADAIAKKGFRTQIIHTGIEKVVDGTFSLARYVNEHKVPVVGFSMHFHQQISDVLEAAKKIKAKAPNVFIVLGGMTASFFAKDILREYQQIDAVIRGEAEGPLPDLIELVKKGERDFSDTANLVWRHNGPVIENTHSYIVSEEELNNLDFTRLSYMRNYQYYLDFPKSIFNTKLPAKINYKLSKVLNVEKRNFFSGLAIGRGCYADCFYCGGGHEAQIKINNRKGVIFRSPEKVIESIRELKDYGFIGSYVSFDPHPMSQDYYCDLFRKIREQKIDFNFIFSAWSMPTKEFLDEFKVTFAEKSSISISPETASEHLREKFRGYYYDNQKLLDMLAYCDKIALRNTVFFSLGVPHEKKEDFEETLKLKKYIKKNWKNTGVKAYLIEVEPGSPWHLDPEKYKINLHRRSLDDFIHDQTKPDYSSMISIGFSKDDFFGMPVTNAHEFEMKMLRLKCTHFCRDRKICFIMSNLWKLANKTGLSQIPVNSIE